MVGGRFKMASMPSLPSGQWNLSEDWSLSTNTSICVVCVHVVKLGAIYFFFQATKVFEHSHQAISGLHSSQSAFPEMLQNLKVLYPEETQTKERRVAIPLYDEAKSSSDNVVVCRTPQSRVLYIAFKNKDVLRRYSGLRRTQEQQINNAIISSHSVFSNPSFVANL